MGSSGSSLRALCFARVDAERKPANFTIGFFELLKEKLFPDILKEKLFQILSHGVLKTRTSILSPGLLEVAFYRTCKSLWLPLPKLAKFSQSNTQFRSLCPATPFDPWICCFLTRFLFSFLIFWLDFPFKTHLFDLFALPEEQRMANSATVHNGHRPEEFFFDLTFAPFLKFGVPSHHFVAECVDNGEREGKVTSTKNGCGLCSLAVGILNASGLIKDFDSEFISKFRHKYLSSTTDDSLESAVPASTELRMEEDNASIDANTEEVWFP